MPERHSLSAVQGWKNSSVPAAAHSLPSTRQGPKPLPSDSHVVSPIVVPSSQVHGWMSSGSHSVGSPLDVELFSTSWHSPSGPTQAPKDCPSSEHVLVPGSRVPWQLQ